MNAAQKPTQVRHAGKLSLVKHRRWLAALATGLVLISGGLAFWHYDVKNAFYPKKFGVVEPGMVYRSGRIHPWLIESVLEEHNIKVIVTLLVDVPTKAEEIAQKRAAEKLNVQIFRYPLGGAGRGKVEHYVAAIKAIVTAGREGKPVLVHCAAGVNRTGGVLAAYQLLVKRKSVDEVVAEMRQYGWGEIPKKEKALRDYLNNNLEEIARQLVAEGFITHAPNPIPKM